MTAPPFGNWPPFVPGGTTSSDFVTNNSTVPGVTVTDALNALRALSPARTFFVSTAWPSAADPTKYFSDPQAALAAAASLSPSQAAPCALIFYPGIYPQNLTLVSNVHLFSYTANGVDLTGTIAYHPGVGVNAPQLHANERVDLFNLLLTGATLTYDATGKTDNAKSSVLSFLDTAITGAITASGRVVAGGNDTLIMTNGGTGIGVVSFDGISPFLTTTSIGNTFNCSNCIDGGVFTSCTFFGDVSFVNTQAIGGASNSYFGAVNVDATSTFLSNSGSNFNGPVTVAAGGQADLRKSTVTTLAGLGAINRDTVLLSVGPTAIGANAVPIAPPLMDATYNAILTLVAGALALTGITVTAKTASGFTLTDPAGGHTFDVTIQHP